MTDETVVESDGVRVTKSFDADGFPVPAVRFDVASTRDAETTLTITDQIPDEFDIDQIGFHPEYGSEHWTATGDGVVRFERPIDAGEEFTTVYGVRMGEDEEPSAFLTAPTVAVGEDPIGPDIDDVVPPESSDIVRELAGGERDSIPGLEALSDDGEVAEANEPILDALHDDEGDIVDAETVEPVVADATDEEPEPAVDEAPIDAEPSDEPDTSPEPTVAEVASGAEGSEFDAAPETTDEPEEPPAATLDSDAELEAELEAEPAAAPETGAVGGLDGLDAADVAAALAEQLRQGDVEDDDLAVLRDEFAPTRSGVQLEHLQSRVSEMEAYADALGAFIDENGDAKGLLEDLQRDVADMEATVDRVDTAMGDAADARAELRTDIEHVEAELAGLDEVESRLDRVVGDLDALDERVTGVEDDVADIEDVKADVESIRGEIENIQAWRDQISDVFGG